MVDWQKHPQQPGAGVPPYPPPPGYPPFGYPPLPGRPSTNIGWAIGALIAFWPLAIPSFIAALKVDDLWLRGDIAGAFKASSDARKFGIIGVCVGIGLVVLMILLFVVVFGLFLGAWSAAANR